MGAWIEILPLILLIMSLIVAPHMGAWIEIQKPVLGVDTVPVVAPHMGAWIEIASTLAFSVCSKVAPHMGAWIEIRQTGSPYARR